jgi:hypothetical protein
MINNNLSRAQADRLRVSAGSVSIPKSQYIVRATYFPFWPAPLSFMKKILNLTLFNLYLSLVDKYGRGERLP